MAAALFVFVEASGTPSAVGPRMLQLGLALGIGGSLYLAAAALLKLPELSYVRRLVAR